MPPPRESPARPPRLALPGALLSLAGFVACREAEGPRWHDLSRDFAPRPLAELVARWERDAGATGNHVRALPEGLGVEHELLREDWTRTGESDVWSAQLPGGAFRHGDDGFTRLGTEERRLTRHEGAGAPEPGEFWLAAGRVHLSLASGEEPPERMLLGQRLESGRTHEGRWQVRAAGHCGFGIPVFGGEREEVACDIPAASQLTFLLVYAGREAGPEARPAFKVLLDDELLLAGELEPERARRGERHSLPLPPEGRRGARLAFELTGPRGLGTFFQPVIGPAEIGTYGQRPWRNARPDIVLFLADTFRADNLACYGGDPELAPELNRLAERSLRFTRARSAAAWTLPSISSLLSGLYPGQHGATEKGFSLPEEIETLPELLARAGYRTGAVTDASFFSIVFNMQQGFEWFSEHVHSEWDLETTLDEAREFLEHDDGRPTFLLVHTYRTHQPYRVGLQEDASGYEAIADESASDFDQADSPTAAAARELLLEQAAQYRALYRAGVQGLDQGLAPFLARLEELGFPGRGYLAFTSDHGEALGENQDMFHGGHLWEVKLRVPLLLAGPGLGARDVDWTATLVDVAPTLAELAALEPSPGWPGTSLLALDEERPAFAFQLEKRMRQIAFVEGARKVISLRPPETLERGECDEAYDLEQDPLEERNLASEAAWPSELARRLAPTTLELLRARAERVEARMAPEVMEQLRGIGY